MDGHLNDEVIGLRWSRSAKTVDTVPPALELLLDAAQQVAADTHIGISIMDGAGNVTTLAATDPLVFVLDQIQHDTGEGPGLSAIKGGHTVIVDDSARERRWSPFMARAADVGVRSIVALPLALNDQVLGGMTLYARTLRQLSAERLAHATGFATQAAIIVAQAQRERDLLLALQSSSTINKTVGLVMERFCIDDEEALAYLRRLSRNGGVEILQIAAHLLDQSNELWRLSEEERTSATPPPPAPAVVRSSKPLDGTP